MKIYITETQKEDSCICLIHDSDNKSEEEKEGIRANALQKIKSYEEKLFTFQIVYNNNDNYKDILEIKKAADNLNIIPNFNYPMTASLIGKPTTLKYTGAEYTPMYISTEKRYFFAIFSTTNARNFLNDLKENHFNKFENEFLKNAEEEFKLALGEKISNEEKTDREKLTL